MVAAPIEIYGPEEPMTDKGFPWQPPYTVDVLFELPSDGLRYEVLGGSLVVSPAPAPGHNLMAERLRPLLLPVLPLECEAVTNSAVRMPNGDGRQQTIAPAGSVAALPVVVDADGTVVTVEAPSSR
jgi:hypothetical protein